MQYTLGPSPRVRGAWWTMRLRASSAVSDVSKADFATLRGADWRKRISDTRVALGELLRQP